MTLGGTPYPAMASVNNLFDLLKAGKRMEQPKNCSNEMYVLFFRLESQTSSKACMVTTYRDRTVVMPVFHYTPFGAVNASG